MSRQPGEEVLNATGIAALLDGLTLAVAERFGNDPGLCVIGIRRRGDELARRLNRMLGDRLGRTPDCGTLDITLYRDDFDSLSEQPVVGATDIPFPLDGRTVVLVDDVLFTGRTIRAALDEILELGRPSRVVLVVLVDRGWRELPIEAALVGRRLETARADDVQVLLEGSDGVDRVVLRRGGHG
ncbi:MAG TPA: bifunctional pyr operon transcriptional regulator/uracil phosphoribosyltransferase PyrR [Thermomicrobiaceae bacterium]|nr:bifunctional pyr operon transcriptional regulator/uracil phosphoribosyltransferase PyrR [Thermomicrobiaceae bacterium]